MALLVWAGWLKVQTEGQLSPNRRSSVEKRLASRPSRGSCRFSRSQSCRAPSRPSPWRCRHFRYSSWKGARRGSSARPGINPAACERGEVPRLRSRRRGLGAGVPHGPGSPGLGAIAKRLRPLCGANSEVTSAKRVWRCVFTVSRERESIGPGVGGGIMGRVGLYAARTDAFLIYPRAENGIGPP